MPLCDRCRGQCEVRERGKKPIEIPLWMIPLLVLVLPALAILILISIF